MATSAWELIDICLEGLLLACCVLMREVHQQRAVRHAAFARVDSVCALHPSMKRSTALGSSAGPAYFLAALKCEAKELALESLV